MPADDFRPIPRLATDAERRHLKAITRQAVQSVGGADAFVPATRIEAAALSKYGGNAYPDAFMPADVMLELDRLAGAPLIVGALAGMLGYRLVPAGEDRAHELDIADAQAVAKETGDVVNLLLGILTSGRRLDAADRRSILKEVTEAKASLYRIVAKLAGGAL